MKSASSGDSNPADSSNGSSPKVPPLRIVFSTNSGSGTIGANAANVDHTYSSSGDSATAAGTPDDGTITKTRKRQKTGTNNSNDVSSSCTSSGGGSLRATAASASNSSSPVTTGKRHHHHHHHHHKANNCSSSVASSKRKHSSSSSDSEEDTSVENCDEKNEAASSGAGNSSPGCPSTVNANTPSSSTNVVGTKPTSPGSSNQSEPKVPSLRIVISSSGTSGASNSNSVTQSSSNATNDSQKVSSSNASSSLSSSSNGKNLPYVVSSSTAASSDGNDDVGTTECDNSANTSTSVTTSTTISSSGRVTRSSQRAAQQQQQKQDGDTDRTTVSPTSTSNASSKESSKDGNSESQSKEKSDGREQHSRRRKLRNKQQNQQPARPQQSTEQEDDNESTSSSTSSGLGANSTNGSSEKEPKISKEFQMPSYNCYHMYLNIRKQIDKRRKQMFPVQPKAPQGFKDYLLNKGSYLVEGKIRLPLYGQSAVSGHKNYASLLSSSAPPVSLKPGSALYNLHVEQERARQKLRLQHLIEKEKLQLSTEQEVLRVHGRAALAMANQSVPFSVCTILKDEEIYNTIEAEPDSTSAENGSNGNGNSVASSRNEYQRATYSSSNTTSGVGTDLVTLTGNSGGSSTRSRYNGRLFLSWLQDVDDKWEKIKEETLLRHKREAESLHAIQRLEWEWKMKELGVCDVKSAPVIDEQLVPSVAVSEDFDLLPV